MKIEDVKVGMRVVKVVEGSFKWGNVEVGMVGAVKRVCNCGVILLNIPSYNEGFWVCRAEDIELASVDANIEDRLAKLESSVEELKKAAVDDATFKRNCEEWEREHVGVREEVGEISGFVGRGAYGYYIYGNHKGGGLCYLHKDNTWHLTCESANFFATREEAEYFLKHRKEMEKGEVKLPRVGQIIYVRNCEIDQWKPENFKEFINFGDYVISAGSRLWKYWSPIPREDIE
jgi:hypothetical protein